MVPSFKPFVVALTVVGVSTLVADGQIGWEPPKLFPPFGDVAPTATVTRELVTRLRVGDLDVTLEQTPLLAVQRHFGGTIGHAGDASEFLQWLCLQGADSEGRWAFWADSGEIDGGNVGGVVWMRVPIGANLATRCKRIQGTVVFPVDLKLGQREQQVLATLGPPTVRVKNSVLFVHSHDQTIRGDTFTTSNSIVVRFENGVVDAITAVRTTSS